MMAVRVIYCVTISEVVRLREVDVRVGCDMTGVGRTKVDEVVQFPQLSPHMAKFACGGPFSIPSVYLYSALVIAW